LPRYPSRKIAILIAACLALMVTANPAENDITGKPDARGHVEIGIDSLERRYVKPEFRFEFPLPFALLFSEISYHQISGGKLRGRIDYWVVVGMEKSIGEKFKFEARLNHMCRHLTSQDNPQVFDLNEVVGKVWLVNKNFKLAFGGGGYTGGFADYKSLLLFNGELPSILGSGLSLKCECKLVDFKEILHEAELSFSLSKSTDLFIRNSRHYLLKNNTYIGIRLKSQGKVEKYIESLKMSASIYPNYERHKLSAEGEFRLAFFKTPRRRVTVTTHFIAPISKGKRFWGVFFPEKMVYPISIEYQRKINEALIISWCSRYNLSMPLDRDLEFSASLATGIALKNQWDFDRLHKKIRFDIFAGYNFKHKFETDIKFGMSFWKNEYFTVGSDLRVERNREKRFAHLKLFVEYGKSVILRPFVGFETFTYSQQQPVEEFIFGFHLIKWL
jgi:hypothetical protein